MLLISLRSKFNKRITPFFWLVTALCLLLAGWQIFSLYGREDASDLIINEFVAANGTGLVDEDGDYSDWIEIYNRSPLSVNLSGWSLSDDPTQPEKWTFPDLTLGSHEYLVVFASGKNRKPDQPGGELHTNFRLNQSGEFLGLYSIFQSAWLDTVSPEFPQQRQDMSYGRYGIEQVYGYLSPPTPGSANQNTSGWISVVSPVEFSVERGFYDAPFTVELTTATPGATIRYTTDGQEPTETAGLIYEQPIPIHSTTLLRAMAFKTDFLPSYVDTQTYLFLNDVLHQPADPPGFPSTWGIHPIDFAGHAEGTPVEADYEMDPQVVNDPRYRDSIREALQAIPSLSIVTDIRNFYLYANPRERGRAWERPASIELIYPDPNQPGFQINAGVRIQGGAGRWEFMPKHSFRLFFRGEYGATRLEYPLFPDSPIRDFDTLILRAGADRSYAGHPERNDHNLVTYTRDEWLRASQLAISGVGSHGIFVHLYLNGLYWGLYNVVERPDAAFTAAYLGGREEDWYVVNQSGGVSGASDRFETMLALARQGGLESPEKYEAIKSYLDITQFIDYMILNWYAGTRDWPENNWYAGVLNPSGQVKYLVWDGEESWTDGAEIHLGKSRLADRPNTIKILFEALIENPDFKMELADRLYRHLFNDGALTDAQAQARWLEINQNIERAIIAESARWGDVRFDAPITPEDWLKARDGVLAQMEGNAAKLIALARKLGYYPELDPPVFSRPGGLVATGFNLTMTASGGTIYYTTDGTDPRLPVTDAIAPNAVPYNLPIVLTNTTQIKARVLAAEPAGQAGAAWSALDEATFRVVEQDHKLRMTEIMYNPLGGDDYEFIELQNVGNAELELAGMFFSGIDFTFPAGPEPLAPGAFVVLVRNPDAFRQRYPSVEISGTYAGQLSNKGEKISLMNPRGEVITSVEYDDERGWPISPDGRGDSLVLISPNGDPDDPQNWRASIDLYGSPGQVGATPQ